MEHSKKFEKHHFIFDLSQNNQLTLIDNFAFERSSLIEIDLPKLKIFLFLKRMAKYFIKFSFWMNNHIKTIIFDLGGVLMNLDFKRSIDALNKTGIKNIDSLIHQSGDKNIIYQYRLGLISTEEFRNLIRQSINVQNSCVLYCITNRWNKMLIDIPQEKLDFLLELHSNYTLYLLSNTNELHWQYGLDMFKYKGLTINDFFDKIFLSFEMHKSKPNRDIYEEIIKETNLNPSETLFIDDSKDNCIAAAAFGIQTYCYHIGEDLKNIKKLLK